ncbi:hypothetical protein [Terriglobus aquaticus]|uniref:DUF2330 domain-containing protein n=1 Tax=Terriglobus aquaticus TaxID=940139 RepID=A0ABW9KPD1_9BACT|nr:hypothetical protein [Terriglobus aquaticus]
MSATLIAALLLTPPGKPAGGFRWQRIITPPRGVETQQACVVLDAATFANVAPALRDLRLFQDGTELPYVIEESYDERALNSGVTSDDDRSEYEPVARSEMSGRMPGGAPGNGDLSPWGHGRDGYGARLLVPPHVPIERIRIEPELNESRHLQVFGRTFGDGKVEQEQHDLPAGQTSYAFTLGANLQHEAEVTVTDTTPGPRSESVILEMRKRSLCYQPRSASPLVLYLGGGQGISAKTYGLANGFSVSANRPYATMGPLEPNPDVDHPAQHAVSRLLIAIGVLGATLLLTLWIGLELIRKDRGRPTAAHS